MVRAIIDWFANIGIDGLKKLILELGLLVILIIELVHFIRFCLGRPKKDPVTPAPNERAKPGPISRLQHRKRSRWRTKTVRRSSFNAKRRR